MFQELGRWASIRATTHTLILYIHNTLQIFVEFSAPEQCRQAHSALAGRKFANRVVVTSFFDLVKYHNKEFLS